MENLKQTLTTKMASGYKRPEILSPAGDWECARAAVENGADAIYFGLERFNARMRAKNFTQADLPELMEFLHARGVRGYVTFNTLVFSNELKDAEVFIRGMIVSGVDAAIVQDMGICKLIRSLSPDFPIHGSTQMTVTSAEGVQFAKAQGANLVVLARENSIADINKIQEAQKNDNPLPLEVFVHGALCVAYSGQCLTSESLGGRSANRGECAQACRLPYDLVANGEQVALGDRRYLLSPRDLAGLEVLPDLVKAGVSSLKIEGRLKSPEYVASITRVYRDQLDKVMKSLAEINSPVSEVPPADLDAKRYELEMSFSRGLQTGWFKGTDNQALVHARFGTKRGVYLGAISEVSSESVSVLLEAPLKLGDGVVFDAGKPEEKEEGGRIYAIKLHNTASQTRSAQKGDKVKLAFGHGDLNWTRIKIGQLLWKTNDPALDKDLRASFSEGSIHFRRPLHFEVHGREGTVATVIAHDDFGNTVKIESEVLLEKATHLPLTTDKLKEQLGRLGGTPYTCGDVDNQLEGNVILPVSEINRLRRELVTRCDALRRKPKRWQIVEIKKGESQVTTDQVPSANSETVKPEIIAVIRLPEQLNAAWNAGVDTIYGEFENPKAYRQTVADFKDLRAKSGRNNATLWVAPPRIFKPGEEWILKQVRSSEADGYLVRNYNHLAFFKEDRKHGDFSLNIANPLSAEVFYKGSHLERITASYDLNLVQLEALLKSSNPEWFDITVHQRMPMFHMEHCVFCTFLSTGHDYKDCGRPCEKNRVELKDRMGALLPLKADAGCRNTVFNNRAQSGAEYVTHLVGLGARHFRVEFVNESPIEVEKTLRSYQALLEGKITGTEVWKELKALNQLGVTRGQMETTPQFIKRKGS
jgi:U32 family peptidase